MTGDQNIQLAIDSIVRSNMNKEAKAIALAPLKAQLIAVTNKAAEIEDITYTEVEPDPAAAPAAIEAAALVAKEVEEAAQPILPAKNIVFEQANPVSIERRLEDKSITELADISGEGDAIRQREIDLKKRALAAKATAGKKLLSEVDADQIKASHFKRTMQKMGMKSSNGHAVDSHNVIVMVVALHNNTVPFTDHSAYKNKQGWIMRTMHEDEKKIRTSMAEVLEKHIGKGGENWSMQTLSMRDYEERSANVQKTKKAAKFFFDQIVLKICDIALSRTKILRRSIMDAYSLK